MTWLPSWTAPSSPPPPPAKPGWADDEPTGPTDAPAPGNGWEALTETGLNPDGTRYWQEPGCPDFDRSVPLDQLTQLIELQRVSHPGLRRS